MYVLHLLLTHSVNLLFLIKFRNFMLLMPTLKFLLFNKFLFLKFLNFPKKTERNICQVATSKRPNLFLIFFQFHILYKYCIYIYLKA